METTISIIIAFALGFVLGFVLTVCAVILIAAGDHDDEDEYIE